MEIGTEVVLAGGVTDLHTHLRDPGGTHKEDFAHGTRAAIAGGVQRVIDMVNNPGRRTIGEEQLDEKDSRAQGNIYTDVGFNVGHQPSDDNIGQFARAARKAFFLKSMLNESTGVDQAEPVKDFIRGWREWKRVSQDWQRIVLHADDEAIEEGLARAAGDVGAKVHVAHVPTRGVIEAVLAGRRRGWDISMGVTLEHLTWDDARPTDWKYRFMPPIGGPEDREFIRHHLDDIDVIETDHAPHTLEEKEAANAENPEGKPYPAWTCYGVPSLEAVLPVLVSACLPDHPMGSPFRGNWMNFERLERMTVTRPQELLRLPPEPNTSARVRLEDYEFTKEDVWSKCGWSPYEGWLMRARVVQADLRGTTVFREGEFIGPPQGYILKPAPEAA